MLPFAEYDILNMKKVDITDSINWYDLLNLLVDLVQSFQGLIELSVHKINQTSRAKLAARGKIEHVRLTQKHISHTETHIYTHTALFHY